MAVIIFFTERKEMDVDGPIEQPKDRKQAWFQFGKINKIEENVSESGGKDKLMIITAQPSSSKALPEFFNNKNKSKTPQVYMDYRDFMINTYRLNPHEYLTVTACRRNLAGDVCAIIRVHAVLEQWGLINYQIDPDSKPSAIGPAFTGHFRVSADTPRGIQPLFPAVSASAVVSKSDPLLDDPKKSETALPSPSLLTKQNIFDAKKDSTLSGKRDSTQAGLDAQSPSKKSKISCGTCGVDCSSTRFHATKVIYDICPPCYREGRFPSSLFSGDFVKISSEDVGKNEWKDQDTLLLLEAIEMYDDDWNKIADHVGRNRDECILRFLKLPINDTFVDIPQEKLGPLQYSRLPVSQADNPILSLTAFLASLVPAEVAKAAAKAAIEKISSTKSTSNQKAASPTKQNGSPVEKAAATALGAAAAKASHLSSLEETEMQKATRVTIELQLRKMEMKLSYFQDLEALLESERLELEKARHEFYLARLDFKNGVVKSADAGDGALAVPVESADVEMLKEASMAPLN